MTSFSRYSRRRFLAASAGLFALPRAFQPLTVGAVIDRIKTQVGIPWRAQTVDNLIAGDLRQPVRRIAVTMMATQRLLEQAAARGADLIITHEPTFFTHQDRTDTLQDDPVYQYKRDFLARRGISVFHFHDHWHGRQPDGIATGMIRALGWEKNADPTRPRFYRFAPTTLARLARQMERRLNIRTMRVVGDPNLPVERVMASWGNVGLQQGMSYVPQADVVVVGETHEWELVEYIQDASAAGQPKGLIVLGHLVSEQEGMRYCAEWLGAFVPEVPVDFLPNDEPFWRPGRPGRSDRR